MAIKTLKIFDKSKSNCNQINDKKQENKNSNQKNNCLKATKSDKTIDLSDPSKLSYKIEHIKLKKSLSISCKKCINGTFHFDY